MADPSMSGSTDLDDFDSTLDSRSSDVSATRGSGYQSSWSRNENQDQRMQRHGAHELTPYFYNYENSTNITAQLGSTAYLNCRIKRLKDKTVSWVKREGEKIGLLTWGLQTYSNDARFSLNFENPNNWKLQIKYTQRRDEGTYECQVSTHPPKVLVANLRIVGECNNHILASCGSKYVKFFGDITGTASESEILRKEFGFS
ncbi:Immunoglobulin I-set [Trinorchestia longiramus]|nr:Immunoglobulin I-set [Trinorchestia longiramus]